MSSVLPTYCVNYSAGASWQHLQNMYKYYTLQESFGEFPQALQFTLVFCIKHTAHFLLLFHDVKQVTLSLQMCICNVNQSFFGKSFQYCIHWLKKNSCVPKVNYIGFLLC